MPIYEIANIKFRIDPRCEYSKNLLTPYMTGHAQYNEFISITKDDIKHEAMLSNVNRADLCEFSAILRKISELLLRKYDGILLHSATIIYKEKAYAFVAPSGTGKTTHILLWQEFLGDKMRILNGDKLLIRKEGCKYVAYGNPWQGKENLGSNTSCQLNGIFFLERSTTNISTDINTSDAVQRLINATVFPSDIDGRTRVIDFIGELISDIDISLLKCTIHKDAVEAALSRIEGGTNNEN